MSGLFKKTYFLTGRVYRRNRADMLARFSNATNIWVWQSAYRAYDRLADDIEKDLKKKMRYVAFDIVIETFERIK